MPIEICCSLNDGGGTYAKFLGAAMWSLLANTKESIRLHLLHDNTLTKDNQKRFRSTVENFGASIYFYNLDKLVPRKLKLLHKRLPKTMQSRFSPAAFYRLLLNDVLPAEVTRFIYLDADIIVNLDIGELWRENTGDGGFAAVPEFSVTGEKINNWLCREGGVEDERYFNSGVMLVDRSKFFSRRGILEDGIEFLREHPQCGFVDQDILNWLFAKVYNPLPNRYNTFVPVWRLHGRQTIEPRIYHFDSCSLGLVHPEDSYDRLFFATLIKTPWFDADFLLRAFSLFNKAHDEQKAVVRLAFNLGAKKKRIFCAGRDDRDTIGKLFYLGGSDEYLPISDASGNIDPDIITDNMRKYPPGLALHIIFHAAYEELKHYLVAAGYREQLDFIDGRLFLQQAEGGLGIYEPLILRMM